MGVDPAKKLATIIKNFRGKLNAEDRAGERVAFLFNQSRSARRALKVQLAYQGKNSEGKINSTQCFRGFRIRNDKRNTDKGRRTGRPFRGAGTFAARQRDRIVQTLKAASLPALAPDLSDAALFTAVEGSSQK